MITKLCFQSVENKNTGEHSKVDLNFVTYSTGRNTHPFRDKSGAYIFLPDGVAKVEGPNKIAGT